MQFVLTSLGSMQVDKRGRTTPMTPLWRASKLQHLMEVDTSVQQLLPGFLISYIFMCDEERK